MAPNAGFQENEIQNEIENEPEQPEEIDMFNPFIIAEIDIRGNRISDRDMFDVYDLNYTAELAMQIIDMPPLHNYVGCINCRYPIACMNEIDEVIWSTQHQHIAIAYAVPIFPNSILIRTTLISPTSDIHWQTTVRCRNCNIYLSIPALTIYNTMIDEYSNDNQTIILDASSVAFFRIEIQ